jgi:hypothetical protein
MNLTAHLQEMPAADAEAFRAVVAQLRTWPESHVREGFSTRVMAKIDEAEARRERGTAGYARFALSPWRGLAAAACAVLLLGIAYLTMNRLMPRAARAGDDAAWLASAQEPDGSWDPASHGGSAAYRPALTALSALALARSGDAYEEAVQKACLALARDQQPSGAFGGKGRAERYNHAITTYALASLAPRYPAVKPILSRAVAFIRESQTASGGWDYVAGSEGNAALTAWNLRALDSALAQGVAEAQAPQRKGLRWMRNAVRLDGRVSYHLDSQESSSTESLDALAAYTFLASARRFPELEQMGRHIAAGMTVAPHQDTGTDCYRDYAKYIAFNAAGAPDKAAAIGTHLRSHRAASLREDAWGMVGGNIYARALTLLTQPDTRAQLAKN